MDNIILFIKQFQYMRRCKNKKDYWATMKINFHKAYDYTSWDFIYKLLTFMEFPMRWI